MFVGEGLALVIVALPAISRTVVQQMKIALLFWFHHLYLSFNSIEEMWMLQQVREGRITYTQQKNCQLVVVVVKTKSVCLAQIALRTAETTQLPQI